MGMFTKDIKSMEDMFLHGLQDIYYAENQITKALPKMIDKATNPAIAEGFRNHLAETKGQIERLDQIFQKLGKKPEGVSCPAIDGLIKESDETAGEIEDKHVLDAVLIANAQAVEHYEIARYGTLIAWAKAIGHISAAPLLQATLDEENATDLKLADLASKQGVNDRASDVV